MRRARERVARLPVWRATLTPKPGAPLDAGRYDYRDLQWRAALEVHLSAVRQWCETATAENCADCLAAGQECLRDLQALRPGEQWQGVLGGRELTLVADRNAL